MGNEFSIQTLKVKSKMASQRMIAHVNKKENQLVKTQREIAKLLAEGKEQSAKIKVEGVIREENLCRVMEILQMMCDLICQRVKQIQVSKQCPEDLTEAICTILYCAKRIEIPELSVIGAQFKAKWGQKWFEQSIENRNGRVSKKIREKLSPQPPTRETVLKRLKKIADDNDLDWEPTENNDSDDDNNVEFLSHRNEYSVEFTSKPFGMEWTATEDGNNLWVSNVTPKSQAAKHGVMPGCMLIALNGIDIQNLGAPSIHDKASSMGLPLRITFRKPENNNSKDYKVNPKTVNKCVAILKDPMNWDLDNNQKTELCKKNGANNAEAAAAIFLAQQMMSMLQNQQKQQQQQQQQQFQQQQQQFQQNNMNSMNNMNNGLYGPSNSDFPMQDNNNMNYNNNNNNNMNGYPTNNGMNNMNSMDNNMNNMNNMNNNMNTNDEPPPTNEQDDGLSDLERRFQNLKKGL